MIRVNSKFKPYEYNIEIDESDIKKYKPNSFLEYKQINSDILDMHNKLKVLLSAKKIIIQEVKRIKRLDLAEYEKALAIERKEIEEHKRKNRSNFSSNTNSYGRLERR